MSSLATPTMTPFNLFDATEAFIIEFVGNSGANKLTKYSIRLQDIDNVAFVKTKNNTNIIEITQSIEEYIEENPTYKTSSSATMFYYNYNYYLIFPQNYCVNGSRYSLEISFGNATTTSPSNVYLFKCYSSPKVLLEYGKYQDGTLFEVEEGITEVTIQKSFCELAFSYTQNEGDDLKYYQFFLYKKNGNEEIFLGNSKKIYSSTNIVYGVENYNNLQKYILKLHCVTQNDNEKWSTFVFNINYDQSNVYSDITFAFDKENATNNVAISITQLNGNGANYSFDSTTNGEYVMIQDNAYVNFIDTYQTITKNFLCRIWCRDLQPNTCILTIRTANNDGYIEVFFTGENFVAYKHSCNLTTLYVSNDLTSNIGANQDIYFAMGYYDGRIEMFTTII